jgi:ribonuclease HI
MRRLYLSICVPQMLYGADVFLKPLETTSTGKVRERGVVKQLRTIQRKAALKITGALSSTPTEVLDVYANLLPIVELINKTREAAALRLATLPSTHPLHDETMHHAPAKRKKDNSTIHELMQLLPHHPRELERIPAVRRLAITPPNIDTVIPPDKKTAVKEEAEDRARWKVYSDGSGLDGQIGAAAVLYKDGREIASANVHLGGIDEHTVYEGEAVGSGLGLELLRKQESVEGSVTMVIDNQAATRAVNNYNPSPSSWIWDEWHDLYSRFSTTHTNAKLTIRWSPGHEGTVGNERADEEAKRAAHRRTTPIDGIPEAFRPDLPISKAAARQKLNAQRKSRVEAAWRTSPRYKQTMQYDRNITKGSYLALDASLPRSYAVLIIQLRTGHCTLAKHLHRIGKADSPVCPCCRRADESVAHYLLHCPAHDAAREQMYAACGRDAHNIKKILGGGKLLEPLLWYLYRTGRFRAMHRNLPEPDLATDDEPPDTRVDTASQKASLPRNAKPFG